MTSILALDQGTTSSRALVFAADGQVLATASRPVTQRYPAPGMVEHDGEEIATGLMAAAMEAWAIAGKPSLAAIGLTNQRETVVMFERATGRPMHAALVWQDRRTAQHLAALKQQGAGQEVQRRTGLPLDPYFSAAKIAWLLDHVPGARARAERGEVLVGTVDAFLLFRLTKGAVFATDASNASRTSLVDLQTGDYAEDLLRLFRVPRNCLPEIRASAGDFGAVAGLPGLEGVPIRGVLGDQQAALFGQSCFAPGTGKCTYGTGAFLLVQCGTSMPTATKGLLATIAWRIGDSLHYALEGSVLVAGALMQWLKDGLGLVQHVDEWEDLARSVAESGDVVIVPAFTGLGTPHWDPDARGAIFGLTRGTTRAHLARAALEAIALQVMDLVQAIEASGQALSILHVDGGATANLLLLELQACLLDRPVVRPAQLETTAVGAMRMARLGVHEVTSPEQLPALPGVVTRVAPVPGLVDRERLTKAWQAAVARSKGWAREF